MTEIARVKLIRPRLTTELIRRPRLLATLDAGLDAPLTVISAPAGFGKTTLALDWLDNVILPVAWLSLEESDDSLEVFTACLVAAIRTIFPGALASFWGLLQSSLAQAPTRLGAALCDELAELPEKFILVLDDYHLLRSPDIQALMDALVRRIPPSMHLVILMRYDVQLPFAKLHAEGKICELRRTDLRFTTEEMRELLTRTVKREFYPETLDVLQQRTEGWAVGLRFATLALRTGTNGTEVLQITRELGNQPGDRMVQYFSSEVFLRQPLATQEFLLKTSILERFTADACEALIVGQTHENWRAILDALVREELMVVTLDDRAGWYRYHHLFRDFLRTRAAVAYNAETIAELQRRASQWHVTHGLITEALQYAVAAKEYARAANLVGEQIHHDLDQETARPVLEMWLGLFPTAEWDRHLGLIMAQLWREALRQGLSAIARLLPLAEQRLAEAQDLDTVKRTYYRGEISAIKTQLAYYTNQPTAALELASQALADLPVKSVFARGYVLFYQAVCYQLTGNTTAGINLLTDAQQNDVSGSPYFRLKLLLALANIQLNEADYFSLFNTASNMLELARDTSYLTRGWAHYLLGLVNYEWNQLEAAAQHFAECAELRFAAHVKASHESFCWLALIQQVRSLAHEANATLQTVSRFSDELQVSDLALSTEAYRARLALMQGDMAAALRWTQSTSLTAAPHLMWQVEPHLTRIRIWLAVRKTEQTQAARSEIDTLLQVTRAVHNRRRTIQLLALQALALDALGQTKEAVDALQKSVELAEPGGFKRTFVDLGPGIVRLLDLLLARNIAPGYLKNILSAIAQTAQRTVRAKNIETESERLIEPLSVREMQVLEALAKHMSTKEIAQALVISPLTVKSHIDHIHAKLNVNSRTDAVRVAVAYGLLRSPTEA
ncbi:hypothetical protein FBQ82_03105 [Anaerolineae bacterium CFX7]|nr:hypothetical protein [Anaerolineae bacterium CFX7]